MAPRDSTRDEERGKRLRAARDALNLAPDVMAAQLGITEAELLALENGAPVGPKPTRIKMQKRYKESPRWLIDGVDDIGTRIVRLRMGLEVDQVALGRALKVGVNTKGRKSTVSPTVAGWEQGRRAPKPHLLAALAEELGTTQGYLLHGTGPARTGRPQAPDLAQLEKRVAAVEAHLGRERRDQSSRGMTPETKTANELKKLRADLDQLTRQLGDLGNWLVTDQDTLPGEADQHETGSSGDGGAG